MKGDITMMVGMSKRLKRMGGFGIMAGVRITKRNAMWMIWIACFLGMIWLMWKMLLGGLWGVYFMCLGLAWVFKKPIQMYKEASPKNKAIVLYIVAGFFVLGALPPLVVGDWPVFVVTLLIAAGIAFYGFRKGNAPPTVESEEAPDEEKLQ